MHSRKEKNALVVIKKDISVETKSVRHVTELMWCYWPFKVKLTAPRFVSITVLTLDPEGIKVAKLLLVEEVLGVAEVAVEEEVIMEGHKKQTLRLMKITVENLPRLFTIGLPEFTLSVEQLAGHESQSSGLITLIVEGADVSDVLLDSGATCNVMGQQTWDMLKLKGIQCES